MNIPEEVAIGLLAFLVAFVCLILGAADKGESRMSRQSRRSNPSQKLTDVEDRL